MEMQQIGHVGRLQVQLGSMKTGGADPYYDPAALREVSALRLTSKGVVGLVNGASLLDVHHADHVHSKGRDSSGISVNFTAHYERMRDRFGPNLEDGCAGENILIATDRSINPDELVNGLIIRSTQSILVHLTQVRVAHPCRSFSAYALEKGGMPADSMLKEALQFLDQGTRGFYCEWMGDPVVVQVGNAVFVGPR
jgi:hypothetical protein